MLHSSKELRPVHSAFQILRHLAANVAFEGNHAIETLTPVAQQILDSEVAEAAKLTSLTRIPASHVVGQTWSLPRAAMRQRNPKNVEFLAEPRTTSTATDQLRGTGAIVRNTRTLSSTIDLTAADWP